MPKTTDLRVTSGQFRGRSLKSPNSDATHPMGAREKLALFNMVNVEQKRILDAYAGSGALGIEALSRHASEVIFVEKSPAVARIIRENLLSFDLEMPVFPESVAKFAERPEYQGYFEVILADPPYNHIDLEELAQLASLLRAGGILALSSPAEQPAPDLPSLRLSSTHTYAQARVSVYYRDTK